MSICVFAIDICRMSNVKTKALTTCQCERWVITFYKQNSGDSRYGLVPTGNHIPLSSSLIYFPVVLVFFQISSKLMTRVSACYGISNVVYLTQGNISAIENWPVKHQQKKIKSYH